MYIWQYINLKDQCESNCWQSIHFFLCDRETEVGPGWWWQRTCTTATFQQGTKHMSTSEPRKKKKKKKANHLTCVPVCHVVLTRHWTGLQWDASMKTKHFLWVSHRREGQSLCHLLFVHYLTGTQSHETGMKFPQRGRFRLWSNPQAKEKWAGMTF